jgi:hypothetical protein
MEFLSSSGGPFDGLTSFIGRSFSRRSKKPTSTWQMHSPAFAEYAPARVVAECALTHRALAMQLTEAAIDHYLDLSRKLTEVRRQIQLHRKPSETPGVARLTQIAEDEIQAFERWLVVIEDAVKSAEAEVIAVVHAWEETRGSRNDADAPERGVIHKGCLYLAVPAEGKEKDEEFKLSVIDLRASLNLDGSMAVIDVVTNDRMGGVPTPVRVR